MENTGTWEWFVKKFELISKIDLNAYKRPQMERRINSFMRSVNSPDYISFINTLKTEKDIYQNFVEHITINVSEFFRNPNHWQVLENKIIPLLAKKNSLKVWSAGCSTGEEPYSLAMLLQEKRINLAERILATDIDKEVLRKAALGLYQEKNIQGVPAKYLSRYFLKEDNNFRVSNEIKNMIKFQHHDLLKDMIPRDYDLILCRNVVIYFTEETKEKLYKKFASGLKSKGVLFIGSTEQIFQAKELGLKSIATFFYQKE